MAGLCAEREAAWQLRLGCPPSRLCPRGGRLEAEIVVVVRHRGVVGLDGVRGRKPQDLLSHLHDRLSVVWLRKTHPESPAELGAWLTCHRFLHQTLFIPGD